MSSAFLENYSLAEPTIRGLYDSKLRLAILDALRDGPLRLADLRRAVGANAPNTSTKAKDLEEMGVVERVEGDFKLTPYGKAVREKTQEMLGFYATYEKFKEFWSQRDLGGIPDFLLNRLGDLRNSELVIDNPTNVRAVDRRFYKLMGFSKVFWKGIVPVYNPEWSRLGMNAVERGIEVDLVMTPQALAGLRKSLKESKKANLLKSKKIRLMETLEEPKLMLGVADNFFSINLKLRGVETCFLEADLLSFDPKAIQWGLDLFEYYKKQAKPVKLSDYL